MKREIKKIFIIVLTIITCACLFVGYSVFAKNNDINLPKNVWLEVGETYGFEQIEDKTDWTFYSINEQVVSVNDGGVVYANNIGETLVVLSNEGKQYQVKFYVTERVYNVVLDYTDISLKVGDNKKVTATLYENSQLSALKPTWKLLDDSVVNIAEQNGTMVVTAKNVGSTVIEVSFGKAKAICNVRVMDGNAKILGLPTLSVEKCGTVSWGAVEGAKAYAVKFNNTNWFETDKTTVDCASLAEQLVDFKVSVRALAKDSTAYYDGDYSTIEIKHNLSVVELDKPLNCKEVTGAKIVCQICERSVIDNDYIAPHTYKDGACQVCGQSQTENIQYTFNKSTNSYDVTGVTTDYIKANKEIYIRSSFDDGENGLKPVTAIGNGAFKNLVYLRRVVLPESVTTIGSEAFYSCAALEDITMTGVEQLSSQSSNAFYRCVSLQKMFVGKNFAVTGGVFYCSQTNAADYTARCDVLVCAPESESNVSVSHSNGNFGFTGKVAYYDDNGCSNVTWHYNQDGGVEYMTHTFINGQCSICNAHDENGLAYKYDAQKDGYVLQGLGNFFDRTEIVVPEYYNDGVHGLKNVVKVESEAFISGADRYGTSILNISSIVLPETVTEIGINAFYCTVKLKHLEMPGVTQLPSQALYKSAVQTMVVNPNVSLQGKVAYNEKLDLAYNCTLFIKGDSVGADFNLVNNDQNNLFKEVKYFYSQDNECFTWSYVNGKAKINEHNYANGNCTICGAIKSNDLEYFYNKESDSYEVAGFIPEIISTVVDVKSTYNDGVHGEKPVTYILSGAFMNSYQIISVNLAGITDIGYYAFYGCNKIETVAIPDCTTVTGRFQFSLCDAVTSVFINPNFNAVGTVFSYSDEKMNKKCVAYVLGDKIGDDFDLGLSSNAIFGTAYLRDVEQPYMCETWHYGLDNKPVVEEHEYVDGFCGKCNTSDKYSYDFLSDGYIINEFAQEEISKNMVIPTTVNGLYGEKAVIGVGDNAFFNNTEIESVTFGEQFVNIGESAFEGCTALKEINFNGNSTIGKNAFKGCSSLELVTFGYNTQIGASAFENCTSIKEINFPKLTGLESNAFAGCTSLEKIVFEVGKENACNIGSNVFANCTALKYVDMRNISVLGGQDTIGHVTFTTGEDIFYNCTALETVIVGRRFRVESRQFAVDTSLLSQFTPKAMLYVDMNTFTSEQSSNLSTGFSADSTNIILLGKAYINGIGSYGGITYIDGTTNSTWKWVDGKPVGIGHPRIGEQVSVTFNSGKDNEFTVSLYSWNDWHELMGTELHNFVDGVCSCGETESDVNGYKYNKAEDGYILADGSNFTDKNLVIPAEYEGAYGKRKVIKVMEEAFKNNEYIESIVFPEGLIIGDRAFLGCTSIKELNFPKLTSIGNDAFYGCTSLKKVVFPKGEENKFNLGHWVFGACTSLEYVDIRNVSYLGGTDGMDGFTTGSDIFYNCTALKTIIVGRTFKVMYGSFRIDGNSLFVPQAIIYVDMDTITSPEGNRLYTGFSAHSENVILTGKAYLMGASKLGGPYTDSIDGQTQGTWTFVDGVPTGVGHPYVGAPVTKTFNAGTSNEFTVSLYNHAGYHENMSIEKHIYQDGECVVCGKKEPKAIEYEYSEQLDGYILVNGTNYSEKELVIPQTITADAGEHKIVKVGDYAFSGNKVLEKISFPAGIALGSYAFQYCTELKELNLPKLESIGDCTFRGCTSLKKVVFPKGAENRFNMGDWVFADCTALELADIRNISYLGGEHEGFRVGSKMFYNCISLKAVIVGRTFKVVSNPSFDIDGTTQYTPQGIYYVDLNTITSTSEGNRLDTNVSGGNVIMSGRVYMIGCQTYLTGDLGKIVDGENGSWYEGEDGMPVAVGHASIGSSSTTYTYNEGTENEFSATIYVQSAYHENMIREEHDYKDGKCTICGEVE